MEQIDGRVDENEFSGAMTTVRFAKNVFLWLIFLALVVQCCGLVLVRLKAIDISLPAEEPPAVPAAAPATAPTTAAAATTPAHGSAGTWRTVFEWALPATKFLAMVAGMLLVLTVLLSVKLALVGRTGGVGGFLSAFYWSLLLWVVLIPWQQALPASNLACGALYNFGDLAGRTRDITAGDASLFTHVLYYLRFAVYPLLALGLWLMVQSRFARGYRRMTLGVEGTEVSKIDPSRGKI